MRERGFFLICDIIFWGVLITLLISIIFLLYQIFQYRIDLSDHSDYVVYVNYDKKQPSRNTGCFLLCVNYFSNIGIKEASRIASRKKGD